MEDITSYRDKSFSSKFTGGAVSKVNHFRATNMSLESTPNPPNEHKIVCLVQSTLLKKGREKGGGESLNFFYSVWLAALGKKLFDG